ncbi:MAG: hypothetical protein II956_15990 [Bacteroidales bacterium]|nr:hypothetical protein [Bacteroidales bacterium]
MKPIAIVGIIAGVLGTGTLAFFKVIKPRLQRKQDEQNVIIDGGGSKGTTTTSGGLTSAQVIMLQTNLNATRQAFLVDEKAGKNGAEAKAFLQTFNADLAVDGKYGSKTKTAVKALQTYLNAKANANLKVDGLYGKDTETAYDAWAKKADKSANKKILSGT